MENDENYNGKILRDRYVIRSVIENRDGDREYLGYDSVLQKDVSIF